MTELHPYMQMQVLPYLQKCAIARKPDLSCGDVADRFYDGNVTRARQQLVAAEAAGELLRYRLAGRTYWAAC